PSSTTSAHASSVLVAYATTTPTASLQQSVAWSVAGHPLHAAASASARSRPPLPTSWASENRSAFCQTNRTSAAPSPRSRATVSPERHRDGLRVTSRMSPTQPTTGVGGIARPSVSLYIGTLPETTGTPSSSPPPPIPPPPPPTS